MSDATRPAPMREDDIRPKALLDEFFEHLRRDAEQLSRRRAEFVDVACPFCGEAGVAEQFEKEGFRYVSCAHCRSLYASPRPTPELLREYLETSEAVVFWSTHFYRQTAMARREKMFRPRAARIVDVADAHGVGPDGVCADIGAGYGLFLQELEARHRFGRLMAVEPDARLAGICRAEGFDVVEQWVEAIGAGHVQADVATAFEVIEHVFDPLTFLKASARLVRPGGILFFSTLAASGFDIQVLWAASRSVSPPQHLNFPSIRGAELLMRRAGLEPLEITTPGQLDLEIVRNRLADNPDLDVPRFARSLAAAPETTRHAFQRFLQEHQMSSHIQCVVRPRA